MGYLVQGGAPPDASVSTDKVVDDAITGAKIADDAIDSEHYADGSIDPAHLADDAVSLAKMAAGTDGNIISYDASGNPVAIATGNDGQVLTSAGAGAQPAFEDASGGAWTLIGTQVASASASLTQTGLDSTYDTYAIAFSDLNPETDNVLPYFRMGDSSGIDSGSSDYEWCSWGMLSNQSNDFTSDVDTDDAQILLLNDTPAQGVGNGTAGGFNAMIFLHGPGDSTMRPSVSGTYTYISIYDVLGEGTCTGGMHRNAAGGDITLDRVQFFFSSGDIDTGRMTVWGIKHT